MAIWETSILINLNPFGGSNSVVRKYLVSIANTITLFCCGIKEPDKTTVFKCNLMCSIGPFQVSCSISHLPLFCQGRLARLPKGTSILKGRPIVLRFLEVPTYLPMSNTLCTMSDFL